MRRYSCACAHYVIVFFFNDTATTEIYTLSLHDALPISAHFRKARDFCLFLPPRRLAAPVFRGAHAPSGAVVGDRKSTRLNSSHLVISYAVFCLKKKNSERDLGHWQHPAHGPSHSQPGNP